MQISDLLDLGVFNIRLLAGAGGLQNVVLWAHATEVEDPTSSVAENELLMINGYTIPADCGSQVEYIRRLHRAGLAGLMVPDHHPMYPAKPLTQEALAEAERLSFPILLAVGVQTRYANITRHVATANWSTQAAWIAPGVVEGLI